MHKPDREDRLSSILSSHIGWKVVSLTLIERLQRIQVLDVCLRKVALFWALPKGAAWLPVRMSCPCTVPTGYVRIHLDFISNENLLSSTSSAEDIL